MPRLYVVKIFANPTLVKVFLVVMQRLYQELDVFFSDLRENKWAVKCHRTKIC